MITLIVFGVLFLIGFALLVALLGSSFLKRHSVRMPDRTRSGYGAPPSYRQAPPPRSQPSAREIRSEYREGYGEQAAPQGTGGVAAPRPPVYAPGAPSRVSSGSRWAFIAPVVVVVLVLVVLFGLREFMGSDVRPRLYFCEEVDFTRHKPINRSDTFTRGNVTIYVKSKTPLLMDRAYVEVYRLNTDGYEPYMDKELRVKPEWASFTLRALFDTVGSYMVSVYGKDDVLIAQKNINIVPDHFGYKPVR
jgi:hypothetical protein